MEDFQWPTELVQRGCSVAFCIHYIISDGRNIAFPCLLDRERASTVRRQTQETISAAYAEPGAMVGVEEPLLKVPELLDLPYHAHGASAKCPKNCNRL